MWRHCYALFSFNREHVFLSIFLPIEILTSLSQRLLLAFIKALSVLKYRQYLVIVYDCKFLLNNRVKVNDRIYLSSVRVLLVNNRIYLENDRILLVNCRIYLVIDRIHMVNDRSHMVIDRIHMVNDRVLLVNCWIYLENNRILKMTGFIWKITGYGRINLENNQMYLENNHIF